MIANQKNSAANDDDRFAAALAEFDAALQGGALDESAVELATSPGDDDGRLARAARCLLLLELTRPTGEAASGECSSGRPTVGSDGTVGRPCHDASDAVDDAAVGDDERSGWTPELPRRIDRFEIVDVLGRGGYAVVYLAHDPHLDRLVALKVPHAAMWLSEDARRRFLREAKTTAALKHPNIAAVYETGATAETCWIAAEYCEGVSLAELIAGSPGGIPARQGAEIVAQLADGVAHAHARGVLHRDIKPGNVMLVPEKSLPRTDDIRPDDYRGGKPKLLDFGLGKDLIDGSVVTHSRTVLGTPAYMAPEQAIGKNGQVDARTDVYALGVLLFELVTGERPFRGSVPAVLRQVLHEDPPNPRTFAATIPIDLATICLKCLNKSPAQRYATAQALADDLARFIAREPILARPLGTIGKALRWMRRNPPWVALAAVLLLSVSTLFGGVTWYSIRLQDELDFIGELLADKEARETEIMGDRYVSDMTQASDAWTEGRLPSVRFLLDRHVPRDGEPDVRDFIWHYLRRCIQDNRVLLNGHTAGVSGGAFSPDGTRVATTCNDGVVRVFDAATGDRIADFHGHGGEVNCVAFVGGNDLLISGGDDGAIRFWRVQDEQQMRSAVSAHESAVTCFALSPDGGTLISGAWDGSVKKWDFAHMVQLCELIRHDDHVRAIAFVPHTDRFITMAERGPMRVWDLASEKELDRFESTVRDAYALAVHPDGRHVAVAGAPNEFQIVDMQAKKVVAANTAHAGWIKGVWFSDGGKTVITASHDNHVAIWELDLQRSRRRRLTERKDVIPHGGAILGGAISADEQRLLTCSRDHSAEVWSIREESGLKVLQRVRSRIRAIAPSPDGRLLAIAATPELWLWELNPPRLRATLRTESEGFEDAVFSSDSRYLAATSEKGPTFVWRVDAMPRGDVAPPVVIHDSWNASCVAFNNSGSLLATSHDDGTIRLWNPDDGTAAGEVVFAKSTDATWMVDVGFVGPEQHLVAWCKPSRFLSLRDHRNGREIWRLDDARNGFAISSDRRYVAFGGADVSIRIVDAYTGREVRRLFGERRDVEYLAFSPDARLLAAHGGTGSLKIWAVDRSQEVLTLAERDFSSCRCAFSPDGRTIYAVRSEGGDEWSVVAFLAE